MVCGIRCIDIFYRRQPVKRRKPLLALTLCACANEDDYN